MPRFSLASFWKSLLLSGLISGALLMLAGCGQNSSSGQPSGQTGGTSSQNCDIQSSWAEGFNSLKGLKQAKDLDLAVQGSFTSILSIEGGFEQGSLSTNFDFTVSKVLLDPHHLLRDSAMSVTIHQTGGWIGNKLHQVCDDPLFRVGEDAILFLRQFSPGQYLVIGGPSGRFEVQNGLVTPVNDEGVKLPSGLTEQQFYDQLQKA